MTVDRITSEPAAERIEAYFSYVHANPRLAAVLYWDNHGYFGCSFAVDGHPQSLAALKDMAQSLYGHI